MPRLPAMPALSVLSALLLMFLLALPVAAQQVTLTTVASGFELPLQVTNAGDFSGRIFVTERAGLVRIVRAGQVLAEPFLDIAGRVSTSGERGLLSVAFPPDYATLGHFYAYYADLDGNIVISRFAVSSAPDRADPASEEILLTIAHPNFDNHYGGQLAFGPDGYLYAGTGDGGGAGDPNGNAQNPDSLLGKLLRLDVESGPDPATGQVYRIPPDNPFAGGESPRPEIWAMGLRNPWRFSFARATGDLWITDVGQNSFEEIDMQPAGAAGGWNYGWNILEGDACFGADECTPPARYAPPVAVYGRELGQSVTGGYMHRGMYVFADFVSGRIFALRNQTGEWNLSVLAETDLNISALGEDQAGRLYLCDYAGGTLQRLRFPAAPTAAFSLLVLLD
ncbi:glucose/sorbosone dehydrogenase [Desulfocurvibacter africanus PCS]|uniref:Glucose/sorbosone dehydrogenase n=1 Tax=Desulfocurvibacter africanus PCS TaxID=1262666 RepID=M5PSD3_DESAF|nr:PQQ-dependent sugar dehydrogenase [Desulfocurvibacter africanus]EMG37287.1 glucose/sorbosone dehydrogenase [Desulfocurvibacter africanus PCS]